MVEMMKREALASHWWWFDSHNTYKRSPWFQSTLEELDEKTESILKLIGQDADSFAQRAEMYYKKRPELISMVEEFYRAHRSLAEKYDQLKTDSGTPLHTSLEPALSSTKLYGSEKLSYMENQTYDSYYEACDPEDSVESYIHDPNFEQTIITDKVMGEEEALSKASYDEVEKLKDEIKRLEEENRMDKDELRRKDEEIIEVTKQLTFNEVSYDEMRKLMEELERLEENNKMQKDDMRKLKDEIERLEEKNKMQEDEMRELKEEVERIEENNKMQKDEIERIEEKNNMQKDEIERLEEKNKMQKDQLSQEDVENLEVTRQLSFYAVNYKEVSKLKEEIKTLVEENRIQKDQLRQKDKEKIEVIRQLSLAVDMLKEDNLKLKRLFGKDSSKKWSAFEFNKLKETLVGKLFKDTPR